MVTQVQVKLTMLNLTINETLDEALAELHSTVNDIQSSLSGTHSMSVLHLLVKQVHLDEYGRPAWETLMRECVDGNPNIYSVWVQEYEIEPDTDTILLAINEAESRMQEIADKCKQSIEQDTRKIVAQT